MGVPLYSTSGRYGGYKIINQNLLPPIYFNEQEIHTIFFSLQLLKSVVDSPFDHSYDDLKKKLLHTFPKEKQLLFSQSSQCIVFEGITQMTHIDHLDVLFQMIIKQEKISFDYYRQKKMKRRIMPVRLVIRQGSWYCIGFDLDKNEYRTFRCDYMERITIINHAAFSLNAEEIELGMLTQQQKYRYLHFQVKITHEGVLNYQENRYPNISLLKKEEEYFLVGSFNPSELPFLANYLLIFGMTIQSIKPKELKEEYGILLQQLLDNYHTVD